VAAIEWKLPLVYCFMSSYILETTDSTVRTE
jgi:hypothetical protein